jgi:hypothetical protein
VSTPGAPAVSGVPHAATRVLRAALEALLAAHRPGVSLGSLLGAVVLPSADEEAAS